MPDEVPFPSPVDRPDLVRPRRKWPWVVAGGLVVATLLTVAFLPQIASSRIGRRVIKTVLEGKFRGTVWVASVQTSWRGPTTIVGFSYTDPEGRQFRFKRMDCQLTLRDLLAGNLKLGAATVEELHAEYVVDHGDGSDTLDRLDPAWTPEKAAAEAAAARPSAGGASGGKPRPLPQLPSLSGHVTLKNATFILTRGQVQSRRQYRTDFRSVRFFGVNGTVAVGSLDRPFEVDLAGQVGDERASGTARLVGTLDLGEAGKLDARAVAADLKVELRDVPNANGGLAWVLMPLVEAEDLAAMFGPTLTAASAQVKGEDGELHVTDLSVEGVAADRKPTRLAGGLVFDLAARPRAVGLHEGMSLAMSVALTRGLGQVLAPLNPFLQDAAAGGRVELKVTSLAMPLSGSRGKLSAEGTLAVSGARLASGAVAPGDARPAELTTQAQVVLGDTSARVALDAPESTFAVRGGAVMPKSGEARFSIGGVTVTLRGQGDVAGRLAYTLSVPRPEGLAGAGTGAGTASGSLPERLELPLTGTIEKPRLDFSALAADARGSEYLDRNLVALSQRQRDRLLQLSEKRVESMIEPFEEK